MPNQPVPGPVPHEKGVRLFVTPWACIVGIAGPGDPPLTGRRPVADPAGPEKAALLAGLRGVRRAVSNPDRRGQRITGVRVRGFRSAAGCCGAVACSR